MSERWVDIDVLTTRLMSMLHMRGEPESLIRDVQIILDSSVTKEIDRAPCITPDERKEWQEKLAQAEQKLHWHEDETEHALRKLDEANGKIKGFERSIYLFAQSVMERGNDE